MWGLLWHVGSNFLTMDQTCIPCIARQILHHCTTREVPLDVILNFELNSILSNIHQILRMSLSLTPWDRKFDLIADRLLSPFIQIHVAWRSNLSSRKRSWWFTVECCSPSKIQVFEKPRCLAKLLANKECVTSWALARSLCYITSQLLINLLKTETCGAILLPASEGLHEERQRFAKKLVSVDPVLFFFSSLDFRFSPHKRQVWDYLTDSKYSSFISVHNLLIAWNWPWWEMFTSYELVNATNLDTTPSSNSQN